MGPRLQEGGLKPASMRPNCVLVSASSRSAASLQSPSGDADLATHGNSRSEHAQLTSFLAALWRWRGRQGRGLMRGGAVRAGHAALQLFSNDPRLFELYHSGFREQARRTANPPPALCRAHS